MPVVMITGPSGLTKEAKKQLIEGTLHVLTETYQMPDDRVSIHEVPAENVGHTPLLDVTGHESWAVQSEPARIFVEVCAPPGLPIEAKRKMMRDLTTSVAEIYRISDQRDILVFLQEHPLDAVANNGYLQAENPAFAVPGVQGAAND